MAGFPAVEDATLAVTETMSTLFPEHTYKSFPFQGKTHVTRRYVPVCFYRHGVFRWGVQKHKCGKTYTYAVAVGLPTTFSQLFTQPPSTHGSMTTEQVQTFYRLYEELLLGRQNFPANNFDGEEPAEGETFTGGSILRCALWRNCST